MGKIAINFDPFGEKYLSLFEFVNFTILSHETFSLQFKGSKI